MKRSGRGENSSKMLENTNLEYVVLNNAIVIKLKMNTLDEKKSVTLKGWVYDKKKEPIPGSNGQTNQY